MLNRRVMLYMSTEEFQQIERKANELGISTSRFLVLSATGKIKNFEVNQNE